RVWERRNRHPPLSDPLTIMLADSLTLAFDESSSLLSSSPLTSSSSPSLALALAHQLGLSHENVTYETIPM
ncbi:hypothetical protein A2U01_0086533, partial [Trifolium medium]|nr:hypothetical protein [Trifolium medium]